MHDRGIHYFLAKRVEASGRPGQLRLAERSVKQNERLNSSTEAPCQGTHLAISRGSSGILDIA